jgi:hypothetical protein
MPVTEPDPPTDLWTITTRSGEELARVRGADQAAASQAAEQVLVVAAYARTAGGFAMRRLSVSEAGPGWDGR